MQDGRGLAPFQMLAVGVGADKVHAVDAGFHHLVDGVAAAAPHADNPNDGAIALAVGDFKY